MPREILKQRNDAVFKRPTGSSIRLWTSTSELAITEGKAFWPGFG
jgi:hypothetical protein